MYDAIVRLIDGSIGTLITAVNSIGQYLDKVVFGNIDVVVDLVAVVFQFSSKLPPAWTLFFTSNLTILVLTISWLSGKAIWKLFLQFKRALNPAA